MVACALVAVVHPRRSGRSQSVQYHRPHRDLEGAEAEVRDAGPQARAGASALGRHREARRRRRGGRCDRRVWRPASPDWRRAGRSLPGARASWRAPRHGGRGAEGRSSPRRLHAGSVPGARCSRRDRSRTSDPAGGGASGAMFAKVLKDTGHRRGRQCEGEARPRIPNAEFVVKGESDVAIQQIPELMTVPGVDIVGPPPALQSVTVFTTAVLSSSRSPRRRQGPRRVPRLARDAPRCSRPGAST